MGRNKKVTTVNISPEAFQIGRDEGYNFSELLEEAIMSKNNPRRELTLLKIRIKNQELELNKMKAEAIALEKAVESQDNAIIQDAIEDYLDEYKIIGMVPVNVERRLCHRLGISREELTAVFENHLNHEN